MSLFGGKKDEELPKISKTKVVLPEEQKENLEQDISILGDDDGTKEEKLQQDAVKEVVSAAEDSLRKIHKINLGRCPVCGEHLSQHMTANICEACGWNKYDSPKNGRVVAHLLGGGTVEGDRAYVLKNGDTIVMRGEVVFARIPAHAESWLEYQWTETEIEQRRRQMVEQMEIKCSWCDGKCDPKADGFHIVHAAFGTTQERYCFCCDDCFEAFRKMYPARVHRDCYDRNCNDCNLCTKRFADEAEGIKKMKAEN